MPLVLLIDELWHHRRAQSPCPPTSRPRRPYHPFRVPVAPCPSFESTLALSRARSKMARIFGLTYRRSRCGSHLSTPPKSYLVAGSPCKETRDKNCDFRRWWLSFTISLGMPLKSQDGSLGTRQESLGKAAATADQGLHEACRPRGALRTGWARKTKTSDFAVPEGAFIWATCSNGARQLLVPAAALAALFFAACNLGCERVRARIPNRLILVGGSIHFGGPARRVWS